MSWQVAFEYARAVQSAAARAWVKAMGPQTGLDQVRAWMDEFGLGGMADRVWKFMEDTGTKDPNEVMLWMRSQPEFQQRFPGFQMLSDGDMNAPSIEDYLAYEDTFNGLMKRTGLDAFYQAQNPYGKQLIGQLLANQVSASELADRIEKGFLRVNEAPAQVREAFTRYFGPWSDQALAAYFLDPNADQVLLERQAAIASIGGAFDMSGFGVLGQDVAERIARTGVTQEEALKGMQTLNEMAPLFDETAGEGQGHMGGPTSIEWGGRSHRISDDGTEISYVDPRGNRVTQPLTGTTGESTLPKGRVDVQTAYNDITAEEGAEAVFGTDADAAERVRRRIAERKAAMAGGGGAAEGKAGFTLGSGNGA